MLRDLGELRHAAPDEERLVNPGQSQERLALGAPDQQLPIHEERGWVMRSARTRPVGDAPAQEAERQHLAQRLGRRQPLHQAQKVL